MSYSERSNSYARVAIIGAGFGGVVAAMAGRAILALGLALALAACAAPSARTPEPIAKAGAFVKTAVSDAEKVAWRARAYHSANIRERAAREVEEAEVILRKARDERERIRKVHRAAVAELAALRAKFPPGHFGASLEQFDRYARADQGSDVTDATDRVDRIGAILAAADRHVMTIEQTVATLLDLEFPFVVDPTPNLARSLEFPFVVDPTPILARK